MADLDEFFAAVRRDPAAALELLRAEPGLARAKWEGGKAKIAGSTALHWASHNGHLDLMRALLDAGADIEAAEADWWVNPVTWAADAGRVDAVDLLAERGASLRGDRWSNATPLHAVAQGGSSNARRDPVAYRATAEALLTHGAEIDAVAKFGGQPPPLTPMDDALRVGNVPVAELLRARGGSSAGGVDVEERFRRAWSMYHAAVADEARKSSELAVVRAGGSYDGDLSQLVAHYTLQNDANDQSGLGNHGVVNGPLFVSGRDGTSTGALDFSSRSDHVMVADHASLKLSRALSLCAWIRPRALGCARIVNKWEGAGAASYNLGCDNGGEIWFEIADEKSRGREVIAEVEPSFLDSWHFVVGTFDGRAMRLFIDGELAGQRSVRCSLNTADIPLYLGTGDGRSMPFDGLIGEVRIYNHALDPSEVERRSGV